MAREYQRTHREAGNKRSADWYRENRAYVRANQRERNLLTKYGMTVADFDAMADAQDGRCAVCRVRPVVSVDHCHRTGKVRALLCRQCNSGIGQLGDDPELLRAAVAYLELHTAEGVVVDR